MHRSWNYIQDFIGAAVPWDEASPIAIPDKAELRRNAAMRKHGITGWTVRCPITGSGHHKWGRTIEGVRKCSRCGSKQVRDINGVFYNA